MDSLKKSNKGFSLVELMIAMVASLLIVASLFYSVIGDLKAYESARGTQNLVAKSRMSVNTLRLYIQQAGFRDIEALKANTVYDADVSAATIWNWEAGQIMQGTTSSATITDNKTDSDIIALRFSGAATDGIVSCAGDDIASAVMHEITLYVDDHDQLRCRDNTDAALILDEAVEFLELMYGTTDNPTRYFSANDVADWSSVNRIKVGLLLSQEVSANHLENNNSYTLFNHTVSAANDTNYRTVVVETVIIENQGG
ncbi:hypothetical protein GCM10007916_06100 [Psychromonas marina]|uniref:Prepilin-type N-terminal cleavage/methylation domain-containing protein n=1 Tax=Psychromonas marina TaxID=88364 RepID=A0ABQ6DX18_9GAMM|nr:PilW family protein [Psychromonas marina]GLS89543.1 hypothetical protein GCM10007916_06100 [Psychromonas marina]